MVAGSLALKLGLVLAIVAWVAAIRWSLGRPGAERVLRLAYHAMTACLVTASALLLLAILGHDFRFEYVASYTSRDLPLLYLISAFWAGQSGTFLLWALLGALVGYALLRRGAWEPGPALAFYLPTVLFQLVLMLVPGGDPFRILPETPADGSGLNPLLQDPWMASHPPLVFLGYVALAVPAALALVAVLRRKEQEWLRPALRWSLVSFVTLGSGIVLGGIWAYRTLGWGGYWGWDPVENASLVPWLAVTALLHGLLVQRATGSLGRTNLALALAGYLLVMYATFLTRSGVLANFSVHSFPDGGLYRLLVGILVLLLAVSALALLRRRAGATASVPFELGWPLALSTALVALVLVAALVLVGTSWPILSSLAGQPSAPKAPFYNRATLPLAVAMLALLGVAPLLAWTRRPLGPVAWRLAPVLAFAALGTAGAWAAGARGFGASLLFFAALAALGANALRLVEVARHGIWGTGAALAHLGFALMFVGIVGSSAWGLSQKAELPLGAPVEVLGRTLTFGGHVDGSEPQDRWRVEVREPGGPGVPTEVAVFRTFMGGKPQEFHRPAIRRGLLADLYVAPTGLTTQGGTAELELRRGETIPFGDATLSFLGFGTHATSDQGMTVLANVEVRRGGTAETIALPLVASQAGMQPVPVDVPALGGTRLVLERMVVEQGWIRVRAESPGPVVEVLTVEASTKPLIGVLWLGTLLLGVGCCVAYARHVREARMLAAAANPTSPARAAGGARTTAPARATRAESSRA